MKSLKFIVFLFLAMPIGLLAQKRVITLPFEFEKRWLISGGYDVYFLNNDSDSSFSLVLKDQKKVEYLKLNKNFKVDSKIDMDLTETVFSKGASEYVGGSANGNVFHYIYEEYKPFSRDVSGFLLETIDFGSKTIKQKQLFEISKSEKLLSSFSDNNVFYTIAADDKSNELIFYTVSETGVMKEKHLAFKVPDDAGKHRDKISEYFSNLEVIKYGEHPDLSSAVSSAKLFTGPGKLDFVINEKGHPAHLYSIQLPSFTIKEKFIDFSSFEAGKDKVNVNSFLKDNRLFSLILDKKSIQIAIHDIENGALLSQQEINDETNSAIFAKLPVNESRYGKKTNEKDVDDIKSLIKSLQKGTEGIMVTENNKGQFIVTIGTYNLIPLKSGPGGMYVGGFEKIPQSTASTNRSLNEMTTRFVTTYKPGAPTFTRTSARYYTTTYFKLLMDPNASKFDKGKLDPSIPEQIKDYMESADPNLKATNQFAIGEKQFYGYYDRDSKAYVIEEIRMRK